MLFLGSIVLASFFVSHPVGGASPGYTAGVKAGDWWTLGNFQGSCQAPCPPGFQSALDLSEATAIVVQEPNATSVVIKNTVAFNNDTIKTYTTTGDLSSGSGNLSFVSSILIAGGLGQGNPIDKGSGAPTINGTEGLVVAGANRTINILNDVGTQQTFLWDRATGVLVSFLLNQTSAHISYQLTGTNLWRYRIAIYDGGCQPVLPVSCGTNPLKATIIAGTTVGFNNTGTGAHTIYSCSASNGPPFGACSFLNYPPNGPSFASPIIIPGKTWNLTITVPGEYYYYDSLDPSRKGVFTVLGNATTPPDFRVVAQPNPLQIPQGTYSAATLSASASNGYTGPVSWGSSFPTGQDYPYITGTLSGEADFYGGCCGAGISFGVYTTFNTPQGTYNATLTGSGNGLTRTVILKIIVGPPGPSFYLTTNSTVDMVAGQTKSVSIEVHSVAGYSSPVNLASNAYSNGPVFSINPSIVTPPPNGIANATITISASAAGNYTITISAGNQTLMFNNRIVINVDVHPQIGLLLYRLYYYGTLLPGDSLLLMNKFTNIGNVPDQVLSGSIVIEFGTYPFSITPPRIIEPGQTTTYNLTITIPIDATPGNHTVTSTIIWMAQLGIFWTGAPPLVLHGQIPVLATGPPPPTPPTVPKSNSTPGITKTVSDLASFAKSYWFWAAIVYIPTVTALSSLFLIREQQRRRNQFKTERLQ